LNKKEFFYSFSWTSKEFNCGNRGMKKTARMELYVWLLYVWMISIASVWITK
jgi:hypothetical protein